MQSFVHVYPHFLTTDGRLPPSGAPRAQHNGSRATANHPNGSKIELSVYRDERYSAFMIGFALTMALALQVPPHDGWTELRQQWAHNPHDKRVEASVAEYAADADFIDPTGNRVHGTAGLRQLFQTVTTTFDSDLVFESKRVETSGDLAYDSGIYRETLTNRATGKAQPMTGSYLTIYRRGKDGAWLIVEQVWTGGPQ